MTDRFDPLDPATERRKKPKEVLTPAVVCAVRDGALPPHYPFLTEEQIEKIAERAAKVALENVYKEIGKSVVSKFLWAVGAVVLAAYAYLKGAGKA